MPQALRCHLLEGHQRAPPTTTEETGRRGFPHPGGYCPGKGDDACRTLPLSPELNDRVLLPLTKLGSRALLGETSKVWIGR